MKRFMVWLAGFIVVAGIVFILGPRPNADPTLRFDVSAIGNDLDAYLKTSEAKVKNIRAGAEKEIIWADPANKAQTEVAIVYIHGFSATKQEARPVPDNLAFALKANLFLTRLEGHGVDGKGLANATFNGWLNDFAEAIAIGEKLGKKVVLVSMSTGSTLVTWAAANKPDLMKNVIGNVMMSPNFALHGASISLMNMQWGEYILPKVVGEERSWEPANEEHGKWWTTTYPSRAIFPMAALMRETEKIDKSLINLKTLVFYSPNDKVVVSASVEKAIAEWGAKIDVVVINNADDPNNHVITGDILSPSTTAATSKKITDWITALLLR